MMAKKKRKSARKRISAALTRFLKRTNPGAFKDMKAVRVRKTRTGLSITSAPVRRTRRRR